MKGIHRLTQATVAAWLKGPREGEPQSKLADGGGLNLVRLPAGGGTWQFRYRLAGKERTYSIGPCEVISLTKARVEHSAVRGALKDGKDPVQLRQLARAAEIASSGERFGDVKTEWLGKKKAEWGEYHYDKSSKALARHIPLDHLPFRDITPAMLAVAIGKIQKNAGRETAAKILRHVSGVFRYGIAKGLRNDNPADSVVEILNEPDRVKHRAAVLTVDGVREVMSMYTTAPISETMRMCHRLIAHSLVRISNAVAARWEEFDLDAGMWVIPREKMKMQDREHAHKVILKGAIVNWLRAWHAAHGAPTTGFLFPGQQGRKHVSREAVEKVLLEHGYRDKHTCHGWRSSFSTLAKDEGFEKEVVDLSLDHIHDTEVARAYDRGERMTKRVKLMSWWAEVLAG